MRFDVYGRFTLDVVREGNQWAVYRLEPGKRIAVRELAIPPSLRDAEIGTFLDDIYHELAKPGQTVKLTFARGASAVAQNAPSAKKRQRRRVEMARQTELPDIAEVVSGILQRVPRDQQPVLLAQRERVSAARYRGWASDVADPGRRSALLACAEREEEIARRVEALYPAAATLQGEILARHPDLAGITGSLFAAYPLDQQFILQARGERFGAATWRSFADGEPSSQARTVFLDCAVLEEESAAFLESVTNR